MTRIISGKFGGIRLVSPKHSIRPTADKVKEYIFNVCQNGLHGAVVADLFSGTGGLGLEAYSRGAETVDCVDSSFKSCRLIRENLEKLQSPDTVRIHEQKSETFIRNQSARYDFVFADPPYDYVLPDEFFQQVKSSLKEGGCFIFEYHSKWMIPEPFPMSIRKSRTFGETGVWIYEI